MVGDDNNQRTASANFKRVMCSTDLIVVTDELPVFSFFVMNLSTLLILERSCNWKRRLVGRVEKAVEVVAV